MQLFRPGQEAVDIAIQLEQDAAQRRANLLLTGVLSTPNREPRPFLNAYQREILRLCAAGQRTRSLHRRAA